MSKGLEWKVAQSDATLVVSLNGAIDEDANLERLAKELAKADAIRFDMSGVTRINSCGVREWVNFMRSLPTKSRVGLERCPASVVSQMNMISNFIGAAKVLTVKAPFVCESCGYDEELLVNVQQGNLPSLAPRRCPKCSKNELVFDDIEESYFAFMR